jgi:predicted metalloprotease
MSQPAWGFPQQTWPGGPQPAGPGFAPWPVQQPLARARNPLRPLLFALIGIALLAVAGLVVAGIASQPVVVPFQNENYQVPPADLNPPDIPAPATLAEAGTWTTANAVYGQSAPAPVRCDLRPIDAATADDALLKSHFETLMACLVRVWQPPLTTAGFQIYRPTVTIYGDEVSTKCGAGKLPHNAFYCGADQQVYWSRTLGGDLVPMSVDRWAGDEVLAHEFGHAIQGRTGILTAEYMIRKAAPTQSASLQSNRRLETQADCLAGIFIRSVSRALGYQQKDLAAIEKGFADGGDEHFLKDPNAEGTHGRSASRKYWGVTGLGTAAVGACNTFTAGPALVR